MSSAFSATVYALAFGRPKPSHSLVLESWARVGSIKFVLITDRPSEWRAVQPKFARNIVILARTISAYFEAAFGHLGISDERDLLERFGWLFHGIEALDKTAPLTGWTACGLRPLLQELIPQEETCYWGWIDYDVLLNAAAVEAHLAEQRERREAVMLMYPASGILWEQFKLFSWAFPAKEIYLEIVDRCRASGERPQSPLEAAFTYQVKGRYPDDGLRQDQIPVHWAYSDRIERLANQYSVYIDDDFRLTGRSGQDVMYFVADTEVRRFGVAQVKRIRSRLAKAGRYCFDYRSLRTAGPGPRRGMGEEDLLEVKLRQHLIGTWQSFRDSLAAPLGILELDGAGHVIGGGSSARFWLLDGRRLVILSESYVPTTDCPLAPEAFFSSNLIEGRFLLGHEAGLDGKHLLRKVF